MGEQELEAIQLGLAEFSTALELRQALLSLDRYPLLWSDRADRVALAWMEEMAAERDEQRTRKLADGLLLLRRCRMRGALIPLFEKYYPGVEEEDDPEIDDETEA